MPTFTFASAFSLRLFADSLVPAPRAMEWSGPRVADRGPGPASEVRVGTAAVLMVSTGGAAGQIVKGPIGNRLLLSSGQIALSTLIVMC